MFGQASETVAAGWMLSVPSSFRFGEQYFHSTCIMHFPSFRFIHRHPKK
jgi:hypothetical protein